MKRKLWDKKIPTVLGMVIIIIGLSITTFLTNKQTFFQTGAQENKQPQEVRITNITDGSFTVSYRTADPTSGYINYGISNSLEQTAFDEKDLSRKLQNHTIHSITLKNLSPQTKYYFSIISDGDTYLSNNKNFEVTTASSFSYSSSVDTMSGKIILPDARIPSEAIVYVTSDNSQVLSSLVSDDGIYTIDLGHLLSPDLSKYTDLSKNSVMQILILGNTLTSNVTFYYSQRTNIPIITLSNNYDFRFQEQKKSSPSAALGSFPIINITSSSKSKGLQILTPGKNQVFSNQKPVLKGEGVPNQNIQILIHSQEQMQATITTDANGNWSFQPNTPLSAGTHTITVTAKDSSGLVRTITQSFIVYAAESSPTPTPTVILLNTSSTNSASPTVSQKPLPATGNTSIITAGIAGLLISFIGGLIFLLSNKGI